MSHQLIKLVVIRLIVSPNLSSSSSKGKQKAVSIHRYAQKVSKLASYNCVFVAELLPKEPYYGSSGKNNYIKNFVVTPASTDEERDDDKFGDQGDNTTNHDVALIIANTCRL